MPNLPERIAAVRNSVFGLFRFRRLAADQANIGIVGTVWCIGDRRFITAQHVLNNGQARQPGDSFELLRAPGNGAQLDRIPVQGFLLENLSKDIAVLEVASKSLNHLSPIQPIPISFDAIEDGLEIFSYGYPEPAVQVGPADAQGRQQGIQTVMMSRANTGIVSAQYPINGEQKLEVTIDWFNGESGGPIIRTDSGMAIGFMQATRKTA